ncbi:MAG: family 16 glycoside hydrolase [Pirellula sp.]
MLCHFGFVATIAWNAGCDNGQPPAKASSPSVTASSPSAADANKPDASNPHTSATVSAKEPQTPVAPQADATPAEAPLDPSVQVEGLLGMRLPKEDLAVGWIRLFDGQSMIGWRNAGNANWRVDDGTLMANSGDPGLLCTSVRFSDFELVLEYKGTDSTNSGVFLRSPEKPKDPAKDCYELNIAPQDNPFPTGSLVGRVKVNEQVDEPESGEWHSLHALVDRDHIQVWVNGQLAADYTDTTGLTSGIIGLQFREGTIRFRDVRVRPITYAILPAKNLKDFNEPAGAVKIDLNEAGSITLTGGKGHLELLQPHANCFIQVGVQTLAENVNSGLFFRCIPGEDMNGYECQIHHGYKEDRRRPVDAGMGAIFRRQSAKAVLSDPDEIAYVTVAADGPRFSTWVGGVQVTDFEDTRAPNPNPRKGLRTEAGTIMLQAHDPTCKVRFDSLNICPLP